jgi:methylated-DNA-protein-cysteine methyltransferase related protein
MKSKPVKERTYFDDVYDVTSLIPKGRVTTYGAIADFLALGSARMVGWALNQLPKNNKIPAHRVINRKGELSGKLMFPSPTTMQERLEKEGIKVVNDKVQFFDDIFWHPQEADL